MLASQTLLSNLRIPYDGLSQTQVNDKAGAVLAAFDAQKAGSYRSPADLPLPVLTDPGTGQPLDMQKLVDDPHSGTNPVVVDAMNAAVEDYHAQVLTANLPAIHQAVDAVNALVPVTKQPVMVPNPDLVILSDSPIGIVQEMAQALRNGEIFDPELMPVDQIIADARAATGAPNLQPTQF